ncbi:MAG: TraM recognition domain-containing protein, partial [Bacteroidales bacterium]|nr:TraM recognition domain-containing protein [Bacteroidales bacterium]
GLDNLIATARSNKVSVCLGFQDFSQLIRDYGDKEAKAIIGTVGNFFSGAVLDDTAEKLSKRFGKVLQKRQSLSINRQDTSTSISTQLDSLIPASKIAQLTQGKFVGMVADNFGEEITQKAFHCNIIVDNEKIRNEEKNYQKLKYADGFCIKEFKDENGVDRMDEIIEANYNQIKQDIKSLIEREQVISDDTDIFGGSSTI